VRTIAAPVTVNAVAQVKVPLLVYDPVNVADGMVIIFDPLKVLVAPLKVYSPVPAVSEPFTTRFPLIPTEKVVFVRVAFVFTVRSPINVAAPIVTVFVLVPSPMVTLGRLAPVAVKTPKVAVPVNCMVPGPLTPLVVVPLLAKVPDTVRMVPAFIINLLVVALRLRFLIGADAVTVTVIPVLITASSVEIGTGLPPQVVVLFQFPVTDAVRVTAKH